ncbi:hypothetical protein F5Y10DRAFT_287796 [Nemania abortiva]|nr:hypothetical protein F5Y10DRAFT_287796 [Nemania abortiva]
MIAGSSSSGGPNGGPIRTPSRTPSGTSNRTPNGNSNETSHEPLDETADRSDIMSVAVYEWERPFAPWEEPHKIVRSLVPVPAIMVCGYIPPGMETAKLERRPWLEKHYTVSLKKLEKASKWFKNWSKLPAAEPGYFEFEVVGLYAFSILMDIFHDRFELVPAFVELETLAKIAELTQMLECKKALRHLPHVWMDTLWRTKHPDTVEGRDLVLWAHIALVFQDHTKATNIINKVICLWSGRFDHLGLSIDPHVVDGINKQRDSALRRIFRVLHMFMYRLHRGETEHSDAYEAILLGTIYKQLPHHYFAPGLLAPGLPIMVTQVIDDVYRLKTPLLASYVSDAEQPDVDHMDAEQSGRDPWEGLMEDLQFEVEAIEFEL